MKLMMTITTAITTKSYVETRRAHNQQQNQTESLNQFNFHFVNDLIISPETVTSTRLLGISETLTFCSRMRQVCGVDEGEMTGAMYTKREKENQYE